MFWRSKSSAPVKNRQRIFAIGDVHGCAGELEALLRKLELVSSDLVVFLGDLVDRGPDAKRVIDLVLDLKRTCRVVVLKGNHEAMFVDFLERPESAGAGLFILNGGGSTLASYEGPDGSLEIPQDHIDLLKTIPIYFETEDYFFVHAGVPDQPLSQVKAQEQEGVMLWIRDPFLRSSYKWEKLVIHGHTPVARPEKLANRINVDTGCVYDGRLTALELPAMKFHQVEKGIKNEPALFPRDLKQSGRVAVRFSGVLPVFAGPPGGIRGEYETLNFNQFGLLIRDKSRSKLPTLQVGDPIEGQVGDESSKAILFSGHVVRVENRGEFACYGVRIDRVSSDGGDSGHEWVERPA